MSEKIGKLHTEQRNPATIGIAGFSTRDILESINREDQTVALAVHAALDQVTCAVDAITLRMRQGGRLVYAAAGTSGRLGIMDASECGPTYGLDDDDVSCLIAGGHEAVFKAQEMKEDSQALAAEDLKAFGLRPQDTVVAVAASGRTPYCVGALDYARSVGALTVSLSCNPDAVLSRHADIPIEVDTGSEVIMGSTRMKAGTAQKMVMNMLSTAVMIRCGRTCDNMMVYIVASNGKLMDRCVRLFCEATGCTDAAYARERLTQAQGSLAAAILMEKSGRSLEEVERVMADVPDFAQALQALR